MPKLTILTPFKKLDAGATIEKPSDIIVYLRETYNETKEEGAANCAWSDAQILATADAIGDDENMILDAMSKDYVEAKPISPTPSPTAKGNISAVRKELEAKELAIKSDNDPAITEHLVKVSDSKRFLAYSARIIMLDLERLYTTAEMAKWPIIGAVSHTEGKRDQPTGHPNPDGYLRPTRRRGSSGTAMAYWSDAFAENLKAIRDLRLELATVKESKTLGDIAKAQAENRLEKAINAMKAKVKAGIELAQQLNRAANYPAVKVDWEMTRVPKLDANGNPMVDPKNKARQLTELVEAEVEDCLILRDPDTAVSDFKTFTISAFCGLDFDKANANGGTLEALFDTAKREKKDTEGFDIDDIEDLRSVTNTYASFIGDKATQVAILREIATENEDNDEFLTALADIVVWARPIVNAMHDRIKAARDKQDAMLNPVQPNAAPDKANAA